MTLYGEQILSIINESEQHLSAEEIYSLMKERSSSVALATVYNNLIRLTENGMIRKVHFGSVPERYDRIAKHDHLVCTKCGKITDIRLDDLTDAICRQLQTDIVSYDLNVQYICPQCRE